MQPRKKIALVAHDHKKRDLLEWIEFNKGLLGGHDPPVGKRLDSRRVVVELLKHGGFPALGFKVAFDFSL